ncbi:unnamed protein product [Cutaneotrichosporon oleaginosum]
MGEAWRCLIATDLDNCTYMLHNSGENRVYDPVASDPLQHATYGPYLALCLQSTPNPTISLRCCLFHDEEGPLILLQPPFLKYDPFIRLATAKGYVVGLTEDGIPYLWQDVDIRLGIYQTTSPKTVPSYFPPPSRLPKRAGLTQLVASVARYSGLDSLVLCALTTENRLMMRTGAASEMYSADVTALDIGITVCIPYIAYLQDGTPILLKIERDRCVQYPVHMPLGVPRMLPLSARIFDDHFDPYVALLGDDCNAYEIKNTADNLLTLSRIDSDRPVISAVVGVRLDLGEEAVQHTVARRLHHDRREKLRKLERGAQC